MEFLTRDLTDKQVDFICEDIKYHAKKNNKDAYRVYKDVTPGPIRRFIEFVLLVILSPVVDILRVYALYFIPTRFYQWFLEFDAYDTFLVARGVNTDIYDTTEQLREAAILHGINDKEIIKATAVPFFFSEVSLFKLKIGFLIVGFIAALLLFEMTQRHSKTVELSFPPTKQHFMLLSWVACAKYVVPDWTVEIPMDVLWMVKQYTGEFIPLYKRAYKKYVNMEQMTKKERGMSNSFYNDCRYFSNRYGLNIDDLHSELTHEKMQQIRKARKKM